MPKFQNMFNNIPQAENRKGLLFLQSLKMEHAEQCVFNSLVNKTGNGRQ